MKKLDDLILKMRGLEEQLIQTIISVIRENKTVILEMNSEQQLYEKGITRDGVSIAEYAPYSPVTIEIKRGKGQPTNRVTLRDEQDFHQSFFLEVTETGFEIKADDWKAVGLQIHYGDEIMGLTDENLSELIKSYIFPELIKTVKAI